MKALFLTNEFPPYIYGGAGVHVEYLSRELAKIIDMEVRCFGDQDIPEGDIITKGYDSSDFVNPNCPENFQGLFKTLATCLKFNMDPIDADVIHCHTWYTHMAGIMGKLLYGKPLVITAHSLEPLRPWKREQLGGGYDKSTWIEKTALEMADCVIAVSVETRQDLLEHFDIDPEKIRVVYNGIDTEQYHKRDVPAEKLQKLGIDPDKPFVLFVGRITRQKGIIHLVNAIKHIEEGVQVVLCAGAPDTDEIEQEMKDAVAEVQKNRDGVIWLSDMLDKDTAIDLYSAADVFCCPSIYEPFGIINLEAMACETAVVAAAVGGIKEVVIEDETGFLIPLEQQTSAPFEPVDPGKFAIDLAHGINKVMADEQLRNRMAKAGRQRAIDTFSWTAIAHQISDLYKELSE